MSSPATAKRLLGNAGAATVSQVWRFGVVFATELVLRRLLPAEDWGLWTWTNAAFLLLSQVRDLGLPAHFIRLTDRPYRTFLRLELLFGGLLAVAVVIAAPWLAQANSSAPPELTVLLLRAFACYLLIDGLARVPLTWFEAEMRIGEAVIAEMARNATFAVLAVVLAFAGFGVWSFVGAHLVAVTVYAAVLWMRSWGRMPLVSGPPGAWRTLLVHSLPLAGIALLINAVAGVDAFVLGARGIDLDVQGSYGFAYKVGIVLLANILVLAARRALYPALVAYRATPDQGFRAYHVVTLLLVSAEVLAAGFLLLNGRWVLTLLGGERNWDLDATTGYLAVLVVAPLVQPFARCAEDVLLARHLDRWLVGSYLLTLASLGGFGWLFSGWFGPLGMAWANLLPLGSLVGTWAIWRWSPTGWKHLAKDLALVYAVGLGCFGGAWLAAAAVTPHLTGPLPNLAFGAAATGLAGLLLYRRFGDEVRDFFASR